MSTNSQPPDLRFLAGQELAGYLKDRPIGGALIIESASRLSDILELLVPEVLGSDFPEWKRESIDGFYFSRVEKISETGAILVGTCILISDQTMTPFQLELILGDDQHVGSVTIKLGEPGAGSLGISGPLAGSRAAQEMLTRLNSRLETVDWVYRASRVSRWREASRNRNRAWRDIP